MAGRPAWPVHTQQDPAVMELGDQIGEMKTFSTGLCQLLGPG
jgi:hypothetical protein